MDPLVIRAGSTSWPLEGHYFLAARRHDRSDASWLIGGPIDGQSFLQYVEQVLVPTLKPGDIVGFHA